jgi:ribose-phosphate pyrophosphokinase
MIDTAGTMVAAADALHEHGASSVMACCSHPVLSGPAIERIEQSSLSKVMVTDTIPLSEEARQCAKIEVVSVAPLLAQAIWNIHSESSISTLFT